MSLSDSILEFVALEKAEPPAWGHFDGQERVILDDVNRRVAAGESIEELLEFLFQAMKPVCGCDRLGIAFVQDEGRRVSARHAVADYEPLLLGRGYSEDLSQTSLRDVIERGTPRLIHDLRSYLEHRPQSASTRLIAREGVRSSMTCPLTVEGRQVGVLFKSSREPNAFSRHDVMLHQAVAERLSQAVEKAVRIEQLEEANQAYLEMLAFVSHELKGPLGTMVTNAELLADGYLGEVDARQREKLEAIRTRGTYLLDLVREYLDLARLEGGSLQPNFAKTSDFRKDVIDPALEIVRPKLEEHGMSHEVVVETTPLAAECDGNLMRIVMTNLTGNAAKYGREGGQVRITAKEAAGGLSVSVWNEGEGFTPDERSRLFRKFSRLERGNRPNRAGTGVGLYSVWRIVRLHGGRVEARSQPGEWAEFSFQLPQPPVEPS